MCIEERLRGASWAREGIRRLPGHAHHLQFRAVSVGAWGRGKGSIS